MSFSDRMSKSSSSSLNSVPEYLAKRTSLPALTSIGMRLPSSSRRPSPTATIVPRCGFSLTVSGITIPDLVVSSRLEGRTTTRSPSGRSFAATSVPLDWVVAMFASSNLTDSRSHHRGTGPPASSNQLVRDVLYACAWHSSRESAKTRVGSRKTPTVLLSPSPPESAQRTPPLSAATPPPSLLHISAAPSRHLHICHLR